MKNPHAQALGKLGGQASAKKPLTPAQVEARRANAAKARAARQTFSTAFPQKPQK
jgi:hypothetical protein